MRPFLKSKRDSVVLEPVTDNELNRLDVVLYEVGEMLIMHRIVRIGRNGLLVIRGDNTYKNEYVSKKDIIAKMTAFTRKGKSGSVNSSSYRLYSALWTAIYPLRFPIYHILRFIKRGVRFVFRIGKKKK
jgi:hypothetical protein